MAVPSPFFIGVAITAIFFAGASCLLGMFAANKKIIKYIPSGVAGIAALTFCIKAFRFSTGFEGLGYLIFTMVSAVIFTVSLISALAMEFINRKR